MNLFDQDIKGRFITIEGIDGAGKTVIAEIIISEIESAGIEIIKTREPGGTEIGESLRKLVLARHHEFSAETEVLVIFAARAQHLSEVILPALREGKWVLSDRFTDSTYAYQGGGRQVGAERIKVIENWLQQDFRPHLTLLLDTDTETGRSRLQNENREFDRFEQESHDFHDRVGDTYRSIAVQDPERVKVIDATQTIEEVRECARMLISDFLRQHHG